MFRHLAIAAAFCTVAAGCFADEFPSRPITIVVPSAAGGLGDIIARQISEKAGATLRATFVVENRPGASGAIGGANVMRAPADGYTILLANGASHGALPALNKKLQYDPIKDFVPIARVGETQLALVASTKLPFKNAQDLLAYARKNPGKLTYATFGHASAGHLFGEVMKKENGIDMLHVPYKGEAAAIQAVIAGEVDLAMIVSAKPYVDQGQVTLIGTTSPDGTAAFPDWPTLASQGVRGFTQARGFQVFLAPAGTPQPIVNKLADAFSRAVSDPEMKRRLLELGVDPATERPEDFPALYRSLVEQWRSIVVASGVTDG
jgi:tripartite-type tricarboxylate transporter receptor subunit TctC